MTDESGVPAADGVPPEDDVDLPPAEAGSGEPPADETPPPPPASTPPPRPATTGAPEPGLPAKHRVGLFGASLFGLFVLAVGVSLVYVLIKIWPKVPHPTTTGGGAGGGGAAAGGVDDQIDLYWGLFKFNLLPETALIVLTAIMGGIGATVFIAVSFSDYVGNRRFAKSWIWFYLVRLFVGPALALIFYFALRGGFLASSSSGDAINPYGVAALAGLVGLFSKQAGDKLRQVFDALFQVDPGHGDEARSDSVTNPAPTIAGVEPPLTRGSEMLTFTLQGTGFIPASTVSVGRSALGAEQPTLLPRATAFLNESELEITLLAEDVSDTGQLWISVTNPAPGGGTAGPQAFEIL